LDKYILNNTGKQTLSYNMFENIYLEIDEIDEIDEIAMTVNYFVKLPQAQSLTLQNKPI